MKTTPGDQPTQPWSLETDPDGLDGRDFDAKDWVLGSLLEMTIDLEKNNAISLSVMVGGTLVSGEAINRRLWFELLIDQVRQVNEGANDFAKMVADALEITVGVQLQQATDLMGRRLHRKLPRPAARYLHLRNARVHTATPAEFPLFRVNMDEIGGWALGSHVG